MSVYVLKYAYLIIFIYSLYTSFICKIFLFRNYVKKEKNNVENDEKKQNEWDWMKTLLSWQYEFYTLEETNANINKNNLVNNFCICKFGAKLNNVVK